MLASGLYGQWLNYPAPGMPRTADGKVKLAVLLVQGLARSDAERLLNQHNGNLRAALQEHG